jgi:hypothetical protein
MVEGARIRLGDPQPVSRIAASGVGGVGVGFRTASKLSCMAEAVTRESVSARIADVREGLTLLADYL